MHSWISRGGYEHVAKELEDSVIHPDRPKVFLSSRFAEFQELRTIVSKLLSAGDSPLQLVNLDDNMPDHRTVRRRSLAELEESEMVLLILGATYSDGADTGELSPTHLEYRAAVAAEKYIWPFATVRPDECADPRQAAFLAEVFQSHTVAALSVDDSSVDQALVLYEKLRQRAAQVGFVADLGDDVRLGGAESEVRNDWRALGLEALESVYLSGAEAVSRPRLAEHLEARSRAMRHLRLGNLAVARKHLLSTIESVDDDWLSMFLLARLSVDPGRPPTSASLSFSEQSFVLARETIDRALPLPGEDSFEIDRATERLLASALLFTNATRRAGKLDKARRGLEAARAIAPLRRDVMTEELLLAKLTPQASVDPGKSWKELLLRLFHAYPYYAIDLLTEPEFADDRPTMSRILVQRMEELAKAMGRELVPRSRSPRAALMRLRAEAADFSATTWSDVRTRAQQLEADWVVRCAPVIVQLEHLRATRASVVVDLERLRTTQQSAEARLMEIAHALPRGVERKQEQASQIIQGLQWMAVDGDLPPIQVVERWLQQARIEYRRQDQRLAQRPPLVGVGRWEKRRLRTFELRERVRRLEAASRDVLALTTLQHEISQLIEQRGRLLEEQSTLRTLQRERSNRLAAMDAQPDFIDSAISELERKLEPDVGTGDAVLLQTWRQWSSRLVGGPSVTMAAYRPLRSWRDGDLVRLEPNSLTDAAGDTVLTLGGARSIVMRVSAGDLSAQKHLKHVSLIGAIAHAAGTKSALLVEEATTIEHRWFSAPLYVDSRALYGG